MRVGEPTLLEAEHAEHMQRIEMGRFTRKHRMIDRLGFGDAPLPVQAHCLFDRLHAGQRLPIRLATIFWAAIKSERGCSNGKDRNPHVPPITQTGTTDWGEPPCW